MTRHNPSRASENRSNHRNTGSSAGFDDDSNDDDEQKWYTVASQVFVPFMIAGFGMVAAGLVLEHVKVSSECLDELRRIRFYLQELKVFREITEIYILVPALLGLKGNLEMTLASRLSTQVATRRRRTPGR